MIGKVETGFPKRSCSINMLEHRPIQFESNYALAKCGGKRAVSRCNAAFTITDEAGLNARKSYLPRRLAILAAVISWFKA
jgi:hypothetical protein